MNDSLLRVRDLKVMYGPKVAIANVNLDVEAGECVCLLGTNGSGKSSLLGAIAGIVDGATGDISFGGRSIGGSSSSDRVRDGLVLCPEGRQLFPKMSVRDNVVSGAYVKRMSRIDIEAAISELGRYFPVLLRRGEQLAGTLSGGEQQMVALGRALISKPRLLLLDEPSLGLSPILTNEMFGIIRESLNEDRTVLVAEQNVLATLKVATHAYILNGGEISEKIPVVELRRDRRLLDRLIGQ